MIPRKPWLETFMRWYWRSKGIDASYGCGYCEHHAIVGSCNECPLNNEICGGTISYFNKWDDHEVNSRWAKYYAKKIFNAVAKDGAQYVTKTEQVKIDEINERKK